MAHRSHGVLAIVAAVTGVAAAGCADPYTDEPRATTPPGQEPVPARSRRDRPSASRAATPEAAVRRAAALTGTWTDSTYAARQATFARESIAGTRAQAERAAARAPVTTLPLESTSRVVAVVRTQRRPRAVKLVLLVAERQRHREGTATARWRAIEATAVRQQSFWAVSSWAPQP